MFHKDPLGLDVMRSKEDFVDRLSSQGLLCQTDEDFPKQPWYRTIFIQVSHDPLVPNPVLFEYDGALHTTIPTGEGPTLLLLSESCHHTGVLFVDHSKRIVHEYHAIDAPPSFDWGHACLGYDVHHKRPGWTVIATLQQGLPQLAAKHTDWAPDVIFACSHINWYASDGAKRGMLPARSEAGFCQVYAYLFSAWYHHFHCDDFVAYVSDHAEHILRNLFPEPSPHLDGRKLFDIPTMDFKHPFVTMLAMTGLLHNACAIAAKAIIDWRAVPLHEIARRAGVSGHIRELEHELGDTEVFVDLDANDFDELRQRVGFTPAEISRLKTVQASLVHAAAPLFPGGPDKGAAATITQPRLAFGDL